MLGNALAKTKPSRAIPVLLINNTNKTFRLRRGCIIGRVSVIEEQAIESVTREDTTDSGPQDVTEEISVPPENREMIKKLLVQNKDLFAKTDAELGHTNTIQMKIDTGNHASIKMRPYRTPIKKCRIVNQTIDEMLDANIIRRSKSPWSFPIVDKKDGTKRFCVDFRQLNKITKAKL